MPSEPKPAMPECEKPAISPFWHYVPTKLKLLVFGHYYWLRHCLKIRQEYVILFAKTVFERLEEMNEKEATGK